MTKATAQTPELFNGNKIVQKLAAAFTLAICCQYAVAQSDQSYDNWYQVELVVFKRSVSNAAYNKETWAKNLALAYPPNVQHLTSTDETTSLKPNTTDTETSQTNADIAAYTPPHSQAYIKLPDEDFFIRGADYALSREKGVAVLFHETWRQPMVALDNAPAIVIRGGDRFGEHTELEGTITLSVSRYLHINTDLWLTQFEANYGQEDSHWPDLPTVPQPISATLENSNLDIALNTENTTGAIAFSAPQTDYGLQLGSASDFSRSKGSNQLLNNFSRLTEKPYVIKEIATLNQKRRMRSDELHYIDHPKMGILIKILPYSPNEKAEEPNDN